MIAGAMKLLARRGLQATSFSEVLELTGAPRGSIYHHFPDGKDQLVAAAIALAGERALQPLEEIAGASPRGDSHPLPGHVAQAALARQL